METEQKQVKVKIGDQILDATMVVKPEEEKAKLYSNAIDEITKVLQDILNLWPDTKFNNFDIPFEMIFKEDWGLGQPFCPQAPERSLEAPLTKLYKAVATTAMICSSVINTDNLRDNAMEFIRDMFFLDPTIGMGLGTSIVGINQEFHTKYCPAFIEYARRYLED